MQFSESEDDGTEKVKKITCPELLIFSTCVWRRTAWTGITFFLFCFPSSTPSSSSIYTNSVLSIHYEYILIVVSSNTDMKMSRETYTKYNSFSFAVTTNIGKAHRIKLFSRPRGYNSASLARKVASRQQFWGFWQTLESLFSLSMQSMCVKFGVILYIPQRKCDYFYRTEFD